MEAWNTMNAEEAIVCAELEQIFPEARQLEGYKPDHPLAVAVKNESPKLLPQIAKAFYLIVTITPTYYSSSLDVEQHRQLRCNRLPEHGPPGAI
jgi:hypothetical protein